MPGPNENIANSMAAERASGGSGQLTAKRRSDFFRSIMVLLVRKQHLATADLATPLARAAPTPQALYPQEA